MSPLRGFGRTYALAGSTLQDIFIGVQGDLLRLGWQHNVAATSGVAGDPDLADAYHAFTEIGKHRNQHPEVLIHFALGNGHVQLYFAALGWKKLVLEMVSRHLRPIDPFIEKPVEP